jgi:Uma2 family endonuclease
VENILQPFLAFALTEALDLAGLITAVMLIASNMGVCAKVDGKTVVKAPDWFFVPQVIPAPEGEIRRSYTPHAEGDIPLIVMEFLSDSDGDERSAKPTYPYGKLWFYERILKVPFYIIYDPDVPSLEVRQLQSGQYERLTPDSQGRYFIEPLNLSLGIWSGTRQEITAHWLRWWDGSGNLLMWGSERIAQKQEQADTERQRADTERQRADTERQRVLELEAQLARYRERFGNLPE